MMTITEFGCVGRENCRNELEARCEGIRVLVDEMYGLADGKRRAESARRRSISHLRQIAMYVCHVVLQISLTDIGTAYGRDRTTVGYACKVIEDRRDDSAYDDFIAAVERVAAAVFVTQPRGGRDAG